MSTLLFIPNDPTIDAIGFDCTLLEDFVLPTEATRAPVARGAQITDHIRLGIEAISAEAIVTNSPIETTFYGVGRDRTLTIFDILGAPVTIQTFEAPPGLDLVRAMVDRLKKLRAARSLVTVVTSAYELENAVISSIQMTRGSGDIGIGRFRFTAEAIKVVSSATVTAPRPKEPKGKGKASAGKAPATEADPSKAPAKDDRSSAQIVWDTLAAIKL